MRDSWKAHLGFGAVLGLFLSVPSVVVAAIAIGDAQELRVFLPVVLVPFVCLGAALVLVLGLARRPT